MPKIDQVLVDLVKEEAAKLREALKPSEAAKLDFSTLNPIHTNRCIYGQATGDCFSKRANNLILKCCQRVYTAGDGATGYLTGAKLNGKPKRVKYRSSSYFSPIEVFIFKASKRRNKKLIQYLRKETDTLDL